MPGHFMQAEKESNNCLHQDRNMIRRKSKLVEDENMELGEWVWQETTNMLRGIETLRSGKNCLVIFILIFWLGWQDHGVQ
jgi:hypothetical protein